MLLPALLLAAAAATAPADDRVLLDQLVLRTQALDDSVKGGFVANHLPSESAVELALARGWTGPALRTIRFTWALRDTVGGGYLHSADNADVHLVKRADSNARRLEMYIAAWRATGDERWRREAARVVDYFERVLLDGRGGFVAEQAGDREMVPEANGYATHAWLSWAAVNADGRVRNFALTSLDRVWDECWVDGLGLLRRGTFGQVLDKPQLVDQVEMGRAFVLASIYANRPVDRSRAVTLGELIVARFEDKEKGGLRTQAVPGKDGKTKKAARVGDENARAARFLCELSALTGDAKYRGAAQRAWRAFAGDFEKAGLESADWALAMTMALEPALPSAPEWRKLASDTPEREPSFRITGIRK